MKLVLEESPDPRTWVIDAMNVMGSQPDGWWRDREGALVRLLERLQPLRSMVHALVVVMDGLARPHLPEASYEGVELCYARRTGRDSADDRIVEMVTVAPLRFRVITSDKQLQSRVARLGTPVHGVSRLSDLLDCLDHSQTPEPLDEPGRVKD